MPFIFEPTHFIGTDNLFVEIFLIYKDNFPGRTFCLDDDEALAIGLDFVGFEKRLGRRIPEELSPLTLLIPAVTLLRKLPTPVFIPSVTLLRKLPTPVFTPSVTLSRKLPIPAFTLSPTAPIPPLSLISLIPFFILSNDNI